MKLRPYQERGNDAVRSAFRSGERRVLAVAPTGSGKGTMATALLASVAGERQRGLFVAHRREIVLDIVERLRVAGVNATPILAGKRDDARSKVQVASLQTLIARDLAPRADLAVFDEAHHYAADEWAAFYSKYARTSTVGFTATPQRSDGRAMGDAFDKLVVVARYGELLKLGHIVPCCVLRPNKSLGIDLAQDPVDAYLKHANGRPAMVFARRVAQAEDLAARFRAASVAAECIEANTPKWKRDETIKRLGDGSLTVVANVFALTEGVDIPRVDTIVLARKCEHESTYVQIVGRELRAHLRKKAALLIDLTGASHRHGLPTDEREYSLEGNGMGEAEPTERKGHEWVDLTPKILGLDLVPVGKPPEPSPAADAKRVRWEELAAEIIEGRRSVGSAARQYASEFGEASPWVRSLPKALKRAELERLLISSGARKRVAAIRYQALFGELPS